LETEKKQMTDDMAKICWYMRGSISWEQVHELNRMEREIISALIKENIETTKKTKLPLL
jgi:hypothetical protein